MLQFFGKLLFPRLPRDLQRRKTNTFLVVLLVTLVFASAVVLMIMFQNKVGGH